MSGRLGAEFDPADPAAVRDRVDAMLAIRGRRQRLEALGYGRPRLFEPATYITDRPAVRRWSR